MTENWPEKLGSLIDDQGTAVRVSVFSVDGSSPREVGAFMTVTADSFQGTVGGGALENAALAVARRMLGEQSIPWRRQLLDYPLGPDLGQCCGGYVQLFYEIFGKQEIAALNAMLAAQRETTDMLLARPVLSGEPPQFVSGEADLPDDWYGEAIGTNLTPLYLYGAGHVGRAVVHVLQGLPFEINWVDTEVSRFPDQIPEGVNQIVAHEPAAIPAGARAGAVHIVMTFSHDMDFDICRGVLETGSFLHLGLIGSKTKQARFALRLRDAGLGEDRIKQLNCPIGLSGLGGKEPAVIAVSLAADLLVRLAADTGEGEPL